MRLVVDIEANGFYEEVTKVHCICMSCEGDMQKYSLDNLETALAWMYQADTLVLHNGIGYDLPVLKKIFDWDYTGRVIDTMILSQITHQERVGGHSLEAWGERLGYLKVQHEDWSVYSPEMLHRCATDVEITDKILQHFESKLGGEIRGTKYQYHQQDISV